MQSIVLFFKQMKNFGLIIGILKYGGFKICRFKSKCRVLKRSNLSSNVDLLPDAAPYFDDVYLPLNILSSSFNNACEIRKVSTSEDE